MWSDLIEKQIENRSGFSTGISISPIQRPPSLSVLQFALHWSISICLTFRTDSSVYPKHTLYQKHFWEQQPRAKTLNAIFFFLFETKPYFVAQDYLDFPV